MEVRFSPELEAKINRVAAATGHGTEEYVRELVEHYIDDDTCFRALMSNWQEHPASAGLYQVLQEDRIVGPENVDALRVGRPRFIPARISFQGRSECSRRAGFIATRIGKLTDSSM